MIQATKLTAQDQAWIRAKVRERVQQLATDTNIEQTREAVELAITVYTIFAEHGIDREALGCVAAIPTEVVDAIKFRDRVR